MLFFFCTTLGDCRLLAQRILPAGSFGKKERKKEIFFGRLGLIPDAVVARGGAPRGVSLPSWRTGSDAGRVIVLVDCLCVPLAERNLPSII